MTSVGTVADIMSLLDLGWSHARIALHYRVSERQVRRWLLTAEKDVPDLPPPLQLSWGTALIVSDTQFPYIDRAAWEVTCQIARDAEVDRVLWDGDMLDFEQLSSYRHNSYKIRQADEDVSEFHEIVRDPLLDSLLLPADEDWIDGNHEFRYTRYLNHNASALGGMPDPRDFLRLPDSVTYQKYGKASGVWLTPKLLVAHGWQARKHSAYTAKANAEDVGGSCSVITGHTHRVGMFAHTTPSGTQGAWEIGHMCDPTDLPKAVEGHQNWQQVVGTLVRYEREGDAFHVEIIPIVGSRASRAICNATGREYVIER